MCHPLSEFSYSFVHQTSFGFPLKRTPFQRVRKSWFALRAFAGSPALHMRAQGQAGPAHPTGSSHRALRVRRRPLPREARWQRSPLSGLSLGQPPPPQLFGRNPRQIRFDVKNRRPIQHIDAANMQREAFTATQFDGGQRNWVRTQRRPGRKHPMLPIVRRR